MDENTKVSPANKKQTQAGAEMNAKDRKPLFLDVGLLCCALGYLIRSGITA